MRAPLILLCSLLLYGVPSAQDLPPNILADLHLLQATKALESGDAQTAIRAFERIESLDTEPPLEFNYFYGKILVEHGTIMHDLIKGQSLLESYVIQIEKHSENYAETLKLLLDVSRRLERMESAKRLLHEATTLYANYADTANIMKAVSAFSQAAERKHPLAIMWLARIYFAGRMGAAKDVDRGKTLAQGVIRDVMRIAALGKSNAQFLLASAHADGLAVPQDYGKAASLYRKAADQGYVLAQTNLGEKYEKGKGVPQDYVKAVKWYRKAATRGEPAAQRNLGVMYEKGQGVQQDYAEAMKWYRKAAERGYIEAQRDLGEMYAEGRGVLQSNAEAVKWYRKAAVGGSKWTQNHLGVMYENGRGVQQNYAEAMKWYKEAAEQGYRRAQYNLGRMYEKGLGINQDYDNAVKWYGRAAEQGHDSALDALGRATRLMKEAKRKADRDAQARAEVRKAERKRDCLTRCDYKYRQRIETDYYGRFWDGNRLKREQCKSRCRSRW